MSELRPGWYERQLARVRADIATWPKWMREAADLPEPDDDIRVLRLHAAILSALPYIDCAHARATLQNAVDETAKRPEAQK